MAEFKVDEVHYHYSKTSGKLEVFEVGWIEKDASLILGSIFKLFIESC